MTAKKALIVDRDPVRIDLLTTCLALRDYRVVTADDAEHGLERFLATCPQIVVLDLELPLGAATRLHERIKATGQTAAAVLYVARRPRGRAADQARRLGAVAILPSPFDADAMRTFQEILDDPAAAGPMRKPPMHVLVIEDDALQRRLIQKCLEVPGREPVQVRFAGSIAEARTAITEARYDCVVIDHQLPDGRGCDLIEEVEDQLLTTPVLGISAHADAETAVEYFRSGCADFLYKDDALQADTLRRCIAAAMSRFQRRAMSTIIERQQLGDAIVQSQERLISLARIDHLTGICNRAVFDDLHPVFHRDAEQQRDPYAVCMIDVDRFKAYNDHYGHASGDDALRQVAQALAASIRAEDFVARYGGEELVALLHEVDGEEARQVAERLRQAVFEGSIPHEHNAGLGRVTVSIGVAPFDPDQPAPPKRLRLLADEALYQAKEAGRNCVVVVPASPHLELTSVPDRSA